MHLMSCLLWYLLQEIHPTNSSQRQHLLKHTEEARHNNLTLCNVLMALHAQLQQSGGLAPFFEGAYSALAPWSQCL